MGLDMYLSGRKNFMRSYDSEKPDRMEDGFRIDHIDVELGYWRKHADLHGFIVSEFAEGVDECQDIELDFDAIDKIIKAVTKRKLPHTEGFFFGESDDSMEQILSDVGVFTKAKEWLESEPPKKRGDMGPHEYRSVIYRASW